MGASVRSTGSPAWVTRSATVAGLVALLSGCTVLMVEPQRPTVNERVAGLSYLAALTYLDSARAQMDKGLKEVDQLDVASRGAVGLGVGGAALTTLGRGPADVVLGLLMVGGTGYSVNQTSQFSVQATIYRAGLESLECIERNGQRVHAETGASRAQLLLHRGRLSGALSALAAATEPARPKAATDSGLRGVVAQADQAIQAGRTLERAVAEFLNVTDVPTEMYFAVNKTVFAVNGQLRARAPNLAEIAQAGALLKDFVANHAKLGADAEAAKAATGKEVVVAQSDSMVAAIHDRLSDLRRVIGEVQALLPAAGSLTAAQVATACQALIPGQGAFAVKPAGPIQLVPGGEAYELSVESDLLPVSYGFHGAVPSAQQLLVSHPGDRTFSLAAPAGAKPATYRFYLYQKDGRQLPDMEVSVGAAPVVAANRPAGPAGVGAAPPAGSFLARRALIGLGTAVKSEADPAWTGRVLKLDNCFGIQPSDGTLREALVAQLNRHERVNAAGDCPKPKAVAGVPATPGVPVPPAPASSSVAPIPAPPALGASS